MFKPVHILALCVAAIAGNAARADTLHLRDGRVLEGTIVEQTRTTLVFDALISTITTRMTFRTREIESVTTGPITTEQTQVRPAKKPARIERETPQLDQTRYLVVPINGVFGEEVGPTGVASVFDYAQRRGIEHLVFHIDSPGGYVWAAEQISSVMAARPDSITCYAVIDDAISAAIWVALSCDRIFIRSGGTIGGAVAYTQESTTGAVEVDAKMNSILAAKLAGTCARNGHPEAIAHAMVVYEQSLYATQAEDGTYTLSSRKTPNATPLDDETTVLTLTGSQVEKFGIGTIFDGDISELGTELGLEEWTLASDFGAAAMQRGQRDLKKRASLYQERNRLSVTLNVLIERITLTEPNAETYSVHEGGAMTSLSIQLWRERTDACMNACREVARVISELEALDRKARRHGIDDILDDLTNLNTLQDAVKQRLTDLRKNRNKTTF